MSAACAEALTWLHQGVAVRLLLAANLALSMATGSALAALAQTPDGSAETDKGDKPKPQASDDSKPEQESKTAAPDQSTTAPQKPASPREPQSPSEAEQK